MATLYELTDELSRLLDAIALGDIPEEAIADTLEGVSGEFDEKCDNIACAIKNLRAEAALIKGEEENLAERRRKKERDADSLTKYLSAAMQKLGKMRLETSRNKIGFRTSCGVRLTDEVAFINWAERYKPDVINIVKKPALAKIKELLAEEEIPYAELEPRQNIQIK